MSGLDASAAVHNSKNRDCVGFWHNLDLGGLQSGGLWSRHQTECGAGCCAKAAAAAADILDGFRLAVTGIASRNPGNNICSSCRINMPVGLMTFHSQSLFAMPRYEFCFRNFLYVISYNDKLHACRYVVCYNSFWLNEVQYRTHFQSSFCSHYDNKLSYREQVALSMHVVLSFRSNTTVEIITHMYDVRPL